MGSKHVVGPYKAPNVGALSIRKGAENSTLFIVPAARRSSMAAHVDRSLELSNPQERRSISFIPPKRPAILDIRWSLIRPTSYLINVKTCDSKYQECGGPSSVRCHEGPPTDGDHFPGALLGCSAARRRHDGNNKSSGDPPSLNNALRPPVLSAGRRVERPTDGRNRDEIGPIQYRTVGFENVHGDQTPGLSIRHVLHHRCRGCGRQQSISWACVRDAAGFECCAVHCRY